MGQAQEDLDNIKKVVSYGSSKLGEILSEIQVINVFNDFREMVNYSIGEPSISRHSLEGGSNLQRSEESFLKYAGL